MDTAAERGGHLGVLRESDFVEHVVPHLDSALAEGKVVLLASHHSFDLLTPDGGELGQPVADAMSREELYARLAAYPNVLASFVGHGHSHATTWLPTSRDHGIWEVQTAAIADYPHQFRLVELWDGGNGKYMLRATAVDVDTTDDPLAEQGRALGITDYTSGWGGFYNGSNRNNVEIWIDDPLR